MYIWWYILFANWWKLLVFIVGIQYNKHYEWQVFTHVKILFAELLTYTILKTDFILFSSHC